MEMQKRYVVIGGIFLLILFLTTAAIFFYSSSPKQQPSSSMTPTLNRSAEKIPVGKQKIAVNNFYKNPIKENNVNDAVIAESSTYQIVYLKDSDEFIISILGTPFEPIRKEAEAAFLKKLGITEKQACTLSVFIGTPAYVNPDLSGRNYPLSFCEQ